jgi:hypothetical protein
MSNIFKKLYYFLVDRGTKRKTIFSSAKGTVNYCKEKNYVLVE